MNVSSVFNVSQLTEELIKLCELAWRRGFMSGWSGNASARLDESSFLITAAGAIKGFLTQNDFVIIGSDGERLAGELRASSEWRVHASLYDALPAARFILHTHPVALQALELRETGKDARAFLSLPLYEARVWLAKLTFARAAPPGSPDAGLAAADAVSGRNNLPRAVWLPLHGLCAVAATPRDTFALTDELEHLASITLKAFP